MDEEAPAVIQPNTLYVPKPEIQVMFTFKLLKDLLHTEADTTRLLCGSAHASRRLQSPSFDRSCLSAAFIQGTGEEAADGGLQHLHRTHPVSVPAPPHPGNTAAWLTENYSRQSYLKTRFKKKCYYYVFLIKHSASSSLFFPLAGLEELFSVTLSYTVNDPPAPQPYNVGFNLK